MHWNHFPTLKIVSVRLWPTSQLNMRPRATGGAPSHLQRAPCRHVPRSQNDPRSRIDRIQDPRSCKILDLLFSFSHGFLEILDPVAATLPRELGDPESETDKILPDPGDPGSRLSKLSWDLADLGSYTTIISLCFDHLLHPTKFCFWFPMTMRCIKLEHCKNFNHILVQPFCFELKIGPPCWFLCMFSIIDILLTACGRRKMNAHFITSWSITV